MSDNQLKNYEKQLNYKNNLIKKWAEYQNRQFSQRRQTDGQQVHKRWSTSLITRRMQIKTTMLGQLLSKGNKFWWGCGEKRTLVQEGCKLVQPLWKTVRRFLQILKIELPYDSAIPFLGIYPKEMKTLIQKDIYTLMFIVALFIIPKTGNNLSTQWWMNG